MKNSQQTLLTTAASLIVSTVLLATTPAYSKVGGIPNPAVQRSDIKSNSMGSGVLARIKKIPQPEEEPKIKPREEQKIARPVEEKKIEQPKVEPVRKYEKSHAYSSPKKKDVVRFYTGVNASFVNVAHRYLYRPRPTYRYNNTKTDHDSYGFGFELGGRKNFGDSFIGLEVFYDQLNNKSKSVFSASRLYKGFESSNHHISNRYGSKINFGHDITNNFEGFVSIGFANVRYKHDTYYSGNEYWNPHQGKVKMFVPLLGGGLIYDINNSWSAKVSCDYQKMRTQYLEEEGEEIITKIITLKSGLTYNF